MKALILLTILPVLLVACTTKTTEKTSTTDSLTLDAVLADTPAPAALAFNPLAGYTVKNIGMQDSINFLLLANQAEVDQNFVFDKTMSPTLTPPDFVINQIIGVACLPSQYQVTLGLEKVEVAEDAINVYVTYTRGAKQSIQSKAAQLFAIERRDGYFRLQFFVNGNKDKVLLMPME